jgi:AraC-like DNA-binding protein
MLGKKARKLKAFFAILADSKIYLAKGKINAGRSVMDYSIVEMLFLHNLSQCGLLERTKITKDGYMEIVSRHSYVEGTELLKPVGKDIVVNVANIKFRQAVDYITKDHPEYFFIGSCNGSMRGIGGGYIKKDEIYRRHCSTGFIQCGIGITFLPEFFDTFLNSRHGVSQNDLLQALNALGKLPLIPDAAVILKQIGEASFTGSIGNIWIEAKALELVSIVLDWHRRFSARELFQLTEHDRVGIYEALHYIEEHLAESVSLGTIAKQAAMSISKFTVTFRKHTGFSAGAYINRLRMEKAMDLLKNTQASIAEITDMVGYKFPANFCTAFLEKFGVTPSEFRKQDNKGN